MTRLRSYILIALLLLVAAPVRAQDLHLMAPWSIRVALDEIAEIYTRRHQGVHLVKNYGVSSVLAKQLENGAPAHVFIAAHPRWADYLKLKNRVSALTVTDLAYNSMVVVVAPAAKVSSLEGLLQLDRIDIGNTETCKREYATEAFRNAGLDKRIAPKIVMTRDALASVERGDLDGAVVFRTEALARKAKIQFPLPQNVYSRVTYPIALTPAGATSKEAQAFYRFLLSEEAKHVLAKHGFLTH